MKQGFPKLIVVVGPTASGKSDLAVALAKKFNGGVISADSRQVYRGMNIGTGKVPGKWQRINGKRQFIYKGVAHHMIDCVSPQRQYTVAEFQKAGRKVINRLLALGSLPIICGGTGFYVQALIGDITIPEVAPNPVLRRKLEKKSAQELLTLLQTKDPERAVTIDAKNKRRLIRALEITAAFGKVPKLTSQPLYETLFISIKLPPEKLRERIRKRLLARLKAGMIKEVKTLHDKTGVSWKKLDAFGLEYRYIARYLKNQISYDEMVRQLELAIWHYAKRQMTWFKKDARIRWIKKPDKAFPLVTSFLTHI